MDIVKIGRFIAEKRKEKNFTQEQLAEKLCVTAKTISKWENGNYMPDISLLQPLSEELGVTLNELLSGEELKAENYQKKLEENIINTISYKEGSIMNKLSKIFLIIIILLALALGLITYYYFNMRKAYIDSANQMVEITELLEEKGLSIYGDKDRIEIKDNNN